MEVEFKLHLIVHREDIIVKFTKFDFAIFKCIIASDTKVRVSTYDQKFYEEFGYFLFWVVH